ncbi:MAG: PAS domain-containing sensor histidine kinase [Methanoregula sp.]
MDRSIVISLQNRPRILGFLILVISAAVLVLNGFGLSVGITNVFPHLFYIPIILTAYFFPRRGVLYACALSAVYCGMTVIISPVFPGELLSAGGRIVMFILIAAVVSFLTLRMQESERQFRGVAERSSDIILLTDLSGKALYVSPSVQNSLGYHPGEITGGMPQAFIHPDDIGLLQDTIRSIIQGSVPDEIPLRMRRKNGDYAVIGFSGSPIIHAGQITGIQVIGRDITERMKAEIALRESEEKYRMLADYTYDWEYWIAPDETIRYTTPSCERITGYTWREFAEDKNLIKKIIHPDDNHALDHHMVQAFTREQPGAVDFRIIHRNGDIRWIGHVCQPIYSDTGEFIGRRASNRDITGRKRIENELRDANRQLADIISFLPDPTMVIDDGGKIVAWNRAMEKLTGIAASSILGKGDYAYAAWFYGENRPVLIDLVLRDDRDAIGRMYPKHHRNGHTILAEIETKRPNGTRLSFWVTATPLFDHTGKIVGAIESLRDVTSQKAIALAWRESKKYLDAIINTISDPVFVKDRKHRFVTLNDGFCRFVGHTREELIGKTDYDFFPADEADIFRKKDEEVFSTRTINENEETLTDARGNRYTIVTKKSLYITSDKEEFLVGIIRDISDRKQMETALREVNKKLNLLSSITRHDINNQLFSLKAFLELSKDSLDNTAEVSEFLLKAERAANAIEHQIAFTREYQNLGVNAPVWQDLSACLGSAVGVLPVRDIQVIDEVGGLEIYADPLFEKVFYNLIDNALHYGGAGMTRIRFTHRKAGQDLIISVEDDGIGITAEDKVRLFERGFGKHTGLGLFLSREILSITGITITENSEPGKGARFEITVAKGMWRIPDGNVNMQPADELRR